MIFLWGISVAIGVSFLTRLLVMEDGPREILRRIRFYAGVNLIDDPDVEEKFYEEEYVPRADMDKHGMSYISNGTFLGDIFSCTNCMSFWTSLFWSIVGSLLYAISYSAYTEALAYWPILWPMAGFVSLYFNMILAEPVLIDLDSQRE
jgi:hypothetical protein